MNSEAFDNYIKDQVLRAEKKPLKDWNAEDTWTKLEQLSQKEPRVLFPWGKIAVAASLLLLIGSTTFLGFQSRNQNRKLSALQEKKAILEQQLEHLELKLQKQSKLAQTGNSIAKNTPKKIQVPMAKKTILPVQILQLPILIRSSVAENDRMALHPMKPAKLPLNRRKSIHNNVEIIPQPDATRKKKKKFNIRFGKKPDENIHKVPSYSFFAMN
ncbi:MAG: hypothetical protein ACEPOZ_02050 [Marinifilaceae bacterium]